jgi:effector-binding domain-containing protein
MEITQLLQKTYLGIIHKDAGMDQMKEIFDKGYAAIGAYVGQNNVQVVGPPVGMYTDYDPAGEKMTAIPAFEVAPGTTVAEDSGFNVIEVAEGKALHHQHVGSYDGLMDAHTAMTKKLEDDNLQMGQYAIEVYMTDPAQETDESKWVTEMYYQLA